PIIPLSPSYLDMKYTASGGLLAAQPPSGYPALTDPNVDPAVIETRLFYDTVKAPGGLATAPPSFDQWKQVFGFPAPLEGASVTAWRARAGVVVYYNQNELGLGRELACTTFDDDSGTPGVSSTGSPTQGIACFVTNYGASFSDLHNSL